MNIFHPIEAGEYEGGPAEHPVGTFVVSGDLTLVVEICGDCNGRGESEVDSGMGQNFQSVWTNVVGVTSEKCKRCEGNGTVFSDWLDLTEIQP